MRFVFSALALVASVAPVAAQQMSEFSTSRSPSGERELRATVDVSGGTLDVGPTRAGELYQMRMRYDANRYQPIQQYDPRTGILALGMKPSGTVGVRFTRSDPLGTAVHVALSPDIPLSLYAVLGANDATLDLGGFTLTDFEVRASASHGVIDFTRAARGNCKSATLTVGAAQLDVHHLASAGCAAWTVNGGAGGALLEWNGEWRRDATLDVDLSMGHLALAIPRGVGVEVTGNRFLAPFDKRGFEQTATGWATPGFAQAAHKLHVTLQASVVNIDVRWIDR